MALTVHSIYSLLKNKYKLNLLAGQNGLYKNVSWIYYTEDSSTIEFIRGSELAISLGLNYQRQHDNKGDEAENLTEYLRTFIDGFTEHGASGLIINTGKYIEDVPQKIIELCNQNNFPLFTMPWEIHTIDVMEEVGNMIAIERLNNLSTENLFYNAIFSPEKFDPNQILNTSFHDAKNFAVVLLEINMERFNNDLELVKRYVNFSFNSKLNLPADSFVSFVHNKKVTYILKNDFSEASKNIARIAAGDKYFYGMKTSLSDSTDNLQDLPEIYNHAVYAMNLNENVSRVSEYNSLGLYKILTEVKNKKVLEQIYNDTLGKLNVFSEDKLTDYMKTLELYLKFCGNIQKISDENFNHRNTVIYRINKLEETMNVDLSDGDTRCMIQIAIYIKKMLKKMKE